MTTKKRADRNEEKMDRFRDILSCDNCPIVNCMYASVRAHSGKDHADKFFFPDCGLKGAQDITDRALRGMKNLRRDLNKESHVTSLQEIRGGITEVIVRTMGEYINQTEGIRVWGTAIRSHLSISFDFEVIEGNND